MKRVKGWIYATKWFNCSMRTNEAKLHHRDTGGRGKCGSRGGRCRTSRHSPGDVTINTKIT